MIQKFKKKPIVIEAIQWTGNLNLQEIKDFVKQEIEVLEFATAAHEVGQGPPFYSIVIPTLEGKMEAIPRDWIIKGLKGEFYPCKPDIFSKTYDLVE